MSKWSVINRGKLELRVIEYLVQLADEEYPPWMQITIDEYGTVSAWGIRPHPLERHGYWVLAGESWAMAELNSLGLDQVEQIDWTKFFIMRHPDHVGYKVIGANESCTDTIEERVYTRPDGSEYLDYHVPFSGLYKTWVNAADRWLCNWKFIRIEESTDKNTYEVYAFAGDVVWNDDREIWTARGDALDYASSYDADRFVRLATISKAKHGELFDVRKFGIVATYPKELPTSSPANHQALLKLAQFVLQDFPEDFPDGYDLQDRCIELGLLVKYDGPKPCWDECECANDDICYRSAEWLWESQ